MLPSVKSSPSNFLVELLKIKKNGKKDKLIALKAICILAQFRRAICSSPPAFEESLEGSKSYGSPQMARPVTQSPAGF